MAISHLLEDFSAGFGSGEAMKLISDIALEDQRLASFEQGYSAGWEDALEAQAQDHTRITAKLAENLDNLSFTYHEAFTQLLTSVEPVFRSVVELVLPDVMARSFGQHIVEQLCDMAHDQISGPATLIVPVGIGATLAPFLAQNLTTPVQIIEEENLDTDQAYLRLGPTEREINGSELLDSIRDAINAFTFQAQEEAQHG